MFNNFGMFGATYIMTKCIFPILDNLKIWYF